MKIRALFVAPYPGLLHVAERLRDSLEDYELTIMAGDLYELKPQLPQIIAGEYEVLISRGGTARLLRSETDLPVSEIPITGFDMVRTLTLIKGYQASIQMIGFPNVIERFSSMSDVLDVDVTYVPIENEDQVDAALQRAKSAGVQVIVGDTFTVGKATVRGFQTVLITSGEEAVLDALENARQLAAIRRAESVRSRQYATLLAQSDEGLAIMEPDGTLCYANPTFRRLLGQLAEDAPIAANLPYIEDLVQAAAAGALQACEWPLYDREWRVNLTGGLLADKAETLYWLKAVPAEESGHYAAWPVHSEPLMAGNWTLPPAANLKNAAAGSGGRYALCGEPGVGKRAYALTHLTRRHSATVLMLRIAPQPAPSPDMAHMQRWLSTLHAKGEGCLYLDGLAHLPEHRQEVLLGSVRELPASVTVVCTLADTPDNLVSQRSLSAGWAAYFGTGVLVFPPLREQLSRLTDWIPLYVSAANQRYGKQIVGVRPEAMAALQQEPWPDNLAGLQQRAEQWVIRSQGPYITLADVRDISGQEQRLAAADTPPLWQGTLHEMEQQFIGMVLAEEQMNATRAAKRLGINRTTLWRKLKQQEL